MMKSQFIKPFGIGVVIALAVVGGAIFATPLLTQHPQSPSSCPSFVFIPTSISGSGFLMSEHIGSGPGPNGMQFVMKPNSTAFINMTYFTGGNSAQSVYANRSRYFVPIQYLNKLPLSNHSVNDVPSAQSGVIVAPVDVTVNGNYTLSVVYEVSASASAMKASYIVDLPGTCGPDIVLTIGNSFYNGPGLTGGAYS